ncbi:hypothetical protein [Actinomadura rugatobispora]|uniref:Outer membrane channel protein CpnT-like N-terminal domain-containing protein n=1 Tax=Actinomadura rugatobispora TaxID=1994 RepID=A0ABW0ZU41_9ACTN
MTLPGELTGLLSMLGYDWPESDEEALFRMGGDWVGFAGNLGVPVGEAETQAAQIWTGNMGEGIDAFRTAFTQEDAPVPALKDAGTAGAIIGAALMVCGAIVLALKINVIIQLIMLAIQIAQAIATAAVTFGASLLQIPLFKIISGIIIDQLINLTLQAIFNG